MTLTQNELAARIDGHVVDDLAGHNKIIGGVSDTDVTEFADIPIGELSASKAVRTVTPVGRWPRTRRNSSDVKPPTGPESVSARTRCEKEELTSIPTGRYDTN
jgi:hypothetical protein